MAKKSLAEKSIESLTKSKFRFRPNRNIDRPSGFSNAERAARGEAMCLIHPDGRGPRGNVACDPFTAATDAIFEILHFCDEQKVNGELAAQWAMRAWQDYR